MDAEIIRRQSALEETHWWFRGRARIILELIPPGPPGRAVLDVGCGWGGLTQHLVGLGQVRGVEPSDVARAEAQRRGLSVLAGSAEGLPVDDASVDLVVSSDVLEHLDDDAVGLREIERVLRPGGIAVITVPACPRLFSSHDVALDHRRRYTRRSLVRAVRAAGLVPERATYFNTWLFPPIALARMLARRRPPTCDAAPTWPPLNALLYRVFASEAAVLRRLRLPIGLSLGLVARRARPGAGGC